MITKIENKNLLGVLEYLFNILFFPFYEICLKWYFKRQFVRNMKYYFSVAAVFMNEARNLKEWVEYYRIIGCDHIFLYNNNSTDNYLEILNPYIKEGFVTLTDWPQQHAQAAAYDDCYERFGDQTFWLAFVDLDEFIVPKIEYDVKDFMRKYEGYPGIILYWQMFGTGGLVSRDYDRLLIEQFTNAWDHLDGTGKYVCCTQPCFKSGMSRIHHVSFAARWFNFKIKIPLITEWKKFVIFPQRRVAPTRNTIQLNHYWSKSYEEFVNKVRKPSAARAENEAIRRKESFFFEHEQKNISESKVIFRFIIKLKIRLYHLDEALKNQ